MNTIFNNTAFFLILKDSRRYSWWKRCKDRRFSLRCTNSTTRETKGSMDKFLYSSNTVWRLDNNFCTLSTSTVCNAILLPYFQKKKIRSDITCTLITYISLITYIVKRQNNLHQLQLFHVQKLSNLHQFFSHKRLRWAMPWEKKGIKI